MNRLPDVSERGYCSRYSDWLRAGRPEGPEFESRQDHEFSFLHGVHTGSGIHTPCYPVGTGGSFPGVKAAGV
jgi:hypothetical protein